MTSEALFECSKDLVGFQEKVWATEEPPVDTPLVSTL